MHIFMLIPYLLQKIHSIKNYVIKLWKLKKALYGRNLYAPATPNNLFKTLNEWEIDDFALETSYLPFNSNSGKVW